MVLVCIPAVICMTLDLTSVTDKDRHMSERLGLGGLCTLMEMHQQPGNSMGLFYVSETRCFYGIQMNMEAGFWYIPEYGGGFMVHA